MFQAWTSSLSAQNVARCRRLSALEADLLCPKLDGLLLVVNDSCNLVNHLRCGCIGTKCHQLMASIGAARPGSVFVLAGRPMLRL